MAPKGNDAKPFLIMPSTWALQETTNVPRNSESKQLLIHFCLFCKYEKTLLPESKKQLRVLNIVLGKPGVRCPRQHLLRLLEEAEPNEALRFWPLIGGDELNAFLKRARFA